jgi:outer membrane lipopolysaccharide assembly protein LptE/RlpB
MKKIITLLIAMAMIIALTACGGAGSAYRELHRIDNNGGLDTFSLRIVLIDMVLSPLFN